MFPEMMVIYVLIRLVAQSVDILSMYRQSQLTRSIKNVGFWERERERGGGRDRQIHNFHFVNMLPLRSLRIFYIFIVKYCEEAFNISQDQASKF
jgi:hypothetical protein